MRYVTASLWNREPFVRYPELEGRCEVQSFVVLSRFSTWNIVNIPSTLLYGDTVMEEMSNSGFSSGCFPSDPQERSLTSDSVLQCARPSVDFK